MARRAALAAAVVVVVVATAAVIWVLGRRSVPGSGSGTPLTSDPVPTTSAPPAVDVLAVKIDNVAAARPQTGLGAAAVVYVEPVEGGVTRLLALYTGKRPAVVGPVRSARRTDLHLLAQWGSRRSATPAPPRNCSRRSAAPTSPTRPRSASPGLLPRPVPADPAQPVPPPRPPPHHDDGARPAPVRPRPSGWHRGDRAHRQVRGGPLRLHLVRRALAGLPRRDPADLHRVGPGRRGDRRAPTGQGERG
ncbi:DUF3048 domain-containing protein [Actinokineospora soli]|uniref:DUF3048 domain-containing protein n=1 Tax=Actinokineospora soli TaxID=1048753 RepID=A0ABW2TP89_9PSEU